ncbi:MAG: hypothetical protein RL431_102 [Actinomycetota bacterium]|jgi:putative endonuclease
MARKDELGRWGETIAADALAQQGYRILDHNWRCEAGEIDIVAVDADTVVFVEVKTRRTTSYGDPLEAITPQKCSRLRVLAGEWCRRNPEIVARNIRIDGVGIVGDGRRVHSLDHRLAIAS